MPARHNGPVSSNVRPHQFIMPTLAEKILQQLSATPGMSDRELTNVLFGKSTHPSQVNQETRLLQGRKQLLREPRLDGILGNFLVPAEPSQAVHATEVIVGKIESDIVATETKTPDSFHSEDEIKKVLNEWLIADGWQTKVAWGRTRGIDIDAAKNDERWVIEVKGQGSLNPMRVNYFLSILGETLQRMSDPNAKYSIALPDLKQFRGLWNRLPQLAKQRTQISILFVSKSGEIKNEA